MCTQRIAIPIVGTAVIGCLALAACSSESRPKQDQAGDMSARSAPSVEELLEVIARYYPRWKRDKETMGDYLDRYPHAPEFVDLQILVSQALDDHARWYAFLTDVRATLAGDASVQEGAPPMYTIPSYQVAITIDGPGSNHRHIVFRFSYLAPVYDIYESHRNRKGIRLTTYLQPTKASIPIVEAVEQVIPRHFDHVRLDTKVGEIRLTDISVGNLSPGQATIADALFDDGRSW